MELWKLQALAQQFEGSTWLPMCKTITVLKSSNENKSYITGVLA